MSCIWNKSNSPNSNNWIKTFRWKSSTSKTDNTWKYRSNKVCSNVIIKTFIRIIRQPLLVVKVNAMRILSFRSLFNICVFFHFIIFSALFSSTVSLDRSPFWIICIWFVFTPEINGLKIYPHAAVQRCSQETFERSLGETDKSGGGTDPEAVVNSV